jgi:hypothetical protein
VASTPDLVSGDPCSRLWHALDSEPRLARELADRSGTNRRAAGQRLRKARQAGFSRLRGDLGHAAVSDALPRDQKEAIVKFRKKPVVIDAIQIAEGLPVADFFDFIGDIGGVEFDEHAITIETLEGRMTASPGDWIIKGVQGELYPCKPDIFDATYERVEAEGTDPS